MLTNDFELTGPNLYILLFFAAFCSHLGQQVGVEFPPNPYWFCTIIVTLMFSGFLCSTLLVVSMTFDRYYSIIRPHKAASFNTVKRAKITIVCIYITGFMFNLPHAILVDGSSYQCVPFGKAGMFSFGIIYYWLSFIVNYALPFIVLLFMNSVIIHTIRNRKLSNISENVKCKDKEKTKSGQNSETTQMFAILLLVTFSMLILNTPAYMFFIYVQVANFTDSPKAFAEYFLFYHSSYVLQVTNYGINFFLYVISGKKFRRDLISLFKIKEISFENIISRKAVSSSTSQQE